MTDGKRNIIRQLLEEYEIESARTFGMRSKIYWTVPSKR